MDGEASDGLAGELAQAGFAVLAGGSSRKPAFLAAPSCHKPKTFFDARASALAAQGARVNVLLSLTRIVHYVRFLAGVKSSTMHDARSLEASLNEALGKLVDPSGSDPARPLREAKAEVVRASGAPYLQAKLSVRTSHQLEGQEFSLRLAAELPARA